MRVRRRGAWQWLLLLLAAACALAVARGGRRRVGGGDSSSSDGMSGGSAALGPSRALMPLFIGKEEEGTSIVKLRPARNSEVLYSCEFRRTTRAESGSARASGSTSSLRGVSSGAVAALAGAHRDVSAVLQKLSGICIRKTLEYWKYELCFDSKLTQSHGRDSFVLGTYAGLEGARQLYDDGSLCDGGAAATGRGARQAGSRAAGGAHARQVPEAREARVEFVCDSSLRLVSVEEVETCSYKVYVTTPLVCGHPEFLQSARNIQSLSTGTGSAAAAVPPKDEWLLEIHESTAGQVACAASALSPAAASLRFHGFELVLSVTGSGPRLQLKPELDVVRARPRRALHKADHHYVLRRSDRDAVLTLTSARAFAGEMTHCAILAQAVPLT
jgi:hypothetical protein